MFSHLSAFCARSKVRDFSRTSVTLEPAEYSSWSEARNELMAEAKNGLRAKLESELGAKVGDESAIAALKSEFEQKERDLEHSIGATCICVPPFPSQPSQKNDCICAPRIADHTVHTFSACLDMQYNVRTTLSNLAPTTLSHSFPFAHSSASFAIAVPLQVSA